MPKFVTQMKILLSKAVIEDTKKINKDLLLSLFCLPIEMTLYNPKVEQIAVKQRKSTRHILYERGV